MSRIVIFSGTLEGRSISEYLSSRKICHEVCVATEYGRKQMEENSYARVFAGRMDEEEMENYLGQETDLVIDATHPYASLVTDNIKKVCIRMQIPCIRVLREESRSFENAEGIRVFPDVKACADALVELEKQTDCNIMLTTGSKDLKTLTQGLGHKERVFVRVLPVAESLSLCEEAGILTKNIIAMQGPFSYEMNLALLKEYRCKVLVTKESGSNGGFSNKMEAAEDAGASCFVIGRPKEEEGLTLAECLAFLDKEYRDGN